MGASQIVCTTASDLMVRLEKAGLTKEMAEEVAREGSGELARAMVGALAAKFAARLDGGNYLLANQRREQFVEWHKKLGLRHIFVPLLHVNNDEYSKTVTEGKDYFFVHITNLDQYHAFMAAVGQATHWTVTGDDDRHKITWELTSTGYWIKAEVAPICPRLKTSWNDLTKSICLLSLEEYVIVWYFLKASGTVIDVSTWCWLRTRFNGSGALNAHECRGMVGVGRSDAEYLSEPYDINGGRASEVVK